MKQIVLLACLSLMAYFLVHHTVMTVFMIAFLLLVICFDPKNNCSFPDIYQLLRKFAPRLQVTALISDAITDYFSDAQVIILNDDSRNPVLRVVTDASLNNIESAIESYFTEKGYIRIRSTENKRDFGPNEKTFLLIVCSDKIKGEYLVRLKFI